MKKSLVVLAAMALVFFSTSCLADEASDVAEISSSIRMFSFFTVDIREVKASGNLVITLSPYSDGVEGDGFILSQGDRWKYWLPEGKKIVLFPDKNYGDAIRVSRTFKVGEGSFIRALEVEVPIPERRWAPKSALHLDLFPGEYNWLTPPNIYAMFPEDKFKISTLIEYGVPNRADYVEVTFSAHPRSGLPLIKKKFSLAGGKYEVMVTPPEDRSYYNISAVVLVKDALNDRLIEGESTFQKYRK